MGAGYLVASDPDRAFGQAMTILGFAIVIGILAEICRAALCSPPIVGRLLFASMIQSMSHDLPEWMENPENQGIGLQNKAQQEGDDQELPQRLSHRFT